MRIFSSSLSRPAMMVVVVMMALAACASGKPPENSMDTQVSVGSYLAGQHARQRGDTGAATAFFMQAIDADPDNVLLLQQGFSLAVVDGRFDDARRLAARLVTTDDTFSLPQLYMALAALHDGEFEKTIEQLQKIPETGLNRLIRPLVHAWALAGMGRFEGALASLAPLQDVTAFQPFALSHRAFLLDFAQSPDAESAYAALDGTDRFGSLRAVLGRVELLLRSGKPEDAAAVVATAKERFSSAISVQSAQRRLETGVTEAPFIASAADGAAEAFYGAALALSQEQVQGSAAFYLRLALYLKPEFGEAYLLLGRIFEGEQQYEAALKIYTQAAEYADVKAQAQLRQVWVLNSLERGEEALAMAEKLLASRPDDVEILATLGDTMRQENRLNEAVDAYNRAIELAEGHQSLWTLYYARAIALDLAKRWQAAEADLKHALELEPEQPDVLNYLGYSWVDRGIHLQEAEDMIKRAVAARPNNGYIIDSLAWVYFKLGRFDEAVSYLEHAVLLQPEDPVINEHLGDAYWRVGRKNEARFQWNHALSLSPPEERVEILNQKLAAGLAKTGDKPAKHAPK